MTNNKEGYCAKKKGNKPKTLADCIMVGGIAGKYFRDMNNDYNIQMERDEISKRECQLITNQRVFPRATNRPIYQVIGLDGHMMNVRLYLEGIENKRRRVETSFFLVKHHYDEIYENS